MLVHHSYDNHFVILLQNLKKKYTEEMFKLEGIDDDSLDISKFTQRFINQSAATADKSIDGNANVDDQSIVSWQYEMPKPIMKLKNHKKDIEKLQMIKSENELMEKQIYDDDRLIESLDIKVNKINEKEKIRSSMLNDFIKQVTDTRYVFYTAHIKLLILQAKPDSKPNQHSAIR